MPAASLKAWDNERLAAAQFLCIIAGQGYGASAVCTVILGLPVLST